MTSGRNTGGRNTAALMAQAREFHRTGDNAAALATISRALEQANTAQGWNLNGDILLALKEFPEAVKAYARAADLQPKHAGYWHDLGRSLLQSGRAAEADAALTRAAVLNPQAWDVLCDLGTAQLEQGSAASALASLAKAVALKSDAGVAHFNLGTALREVGRLDDAEAAFKTAVHHIPHFLPAMISLITLTGDRGRLDEAEQWFAASAALSPLEPQIHQARAMALLRHGQLREGFKAYEWRFQSSQHSLQARPFPAPPWRGESLAGKNILIWTEQGLGDEILAASMFAEVIADARSCTIECSERAAPLFQRSFNRATVVARCGPPDPATGGNFDFQIAASSLGGILRPDFADFPEHDGYITPDSGLVAQLRQRYRAKNPDAPVIGISWDSTARHGALKRLPLEAWGPILEIPGITLVSLQYGVGANHPDIRRLGPDTTLIVDDEVDALASLEASAAQVAAMDLVITASNTTAHLAGAQGIPVWTLLPEGPGCFWYWFRLRSDSPWYPSMRIFRQPRPGAWSPVVENVTQAIVEMNTRSAIG